MTTIISSPNNHDSKRVTISLRVTGGAEPKTLLFDFNREGEAISCNNLTLKAARELRDALVSFDLSDPPVYHLDWATIKVGEKFGFYPDKESADRGKRYPYTKTSETEYINDVGFKKSAPLDGEYASDRLFAEPPAPRPTVGDLMDSLKPGEIMVSGTGRRYIKLTSSKFWSITSAMEIGRSSFEPQQYAVRTDGSARYTKEV